jgi:hypothetical protein
MLAAPHLFYRVLLKDPTGNCKENTAAEHKHSSYS